MTDEGLATAIESRFDALRSALFETPNLTLKLNDRDYERIHHSQRRADDALDVTRADRITRILQSAKHLLANHRSKWQINVVHVETGDRHQHTSVDVAPTVGALIPRDAAGPAEETHKADSSD